jgi:hypothetical protein
MNSTPMVVTVGRSVAFQCCDCGQVLGEEQFAVYHGRRVLWACSAGCRAHYHATQTQEPGQV